MKVKRVLAYGGEEWTFNDFGSLLLDVVEELPEESAPSVRVELVHNSWPDEGDSVYLAVTAEVPDDFTYPEWSRD